MYPANSQYHLVAWYRYGRLIEAPASTKDAAELEQRVVAATHASFTTTPEMAPKGTAIMLRKEAQLSIASILTDRFSVPFVLSRTLAAVSPHVRLPVGYAEHAGRFYVREPFR
jgi:hypothetical protein